MAGREDELASNWQSLLKHWSLEHDAFGSGLADAAEHCYRVRPCHVIDVRWNRARRCRTLAGKALKKTESRYLWTETNHYANGGSKPPTANSSGSD
jgi:hypothetical protein